MEPETRGSESPGEAQPADWYPDPVRSGRLRYWDGVAWTPWVSVDGETALDPIDAGSPTPRSSAAAPPAPAVLTTGGALARGGLAVAALGGVLVAASAGQTATSQGPFFEIRVERGFWGVLVVSALLVGAALAPWLWARLAGLLLAGGLAATGAVLLIAARASDDFVDGIDVSLEPGGWLIASGTLLAFLGLALSLLGIALAPLPVGGGAGTGTAALVLGIASIPFPLVSTLGVALGLIGMKAGRASGSGRGMAIAGLVVALVVLVGWSVPAIVAMLVVEP